MIVDRIENAAMYHPLGEGYRDALEFLAREDLADLETSRHDISGDDCYALVMTYDTKPPEQGVWEAHRKYADVQFVVDGVERMGYANINSLRISQAYDEEKDFLLLEGEGDFLTAPAGVFVVFAPQDAHMPSIAVDSPRQTKKVVVKIRV